MKNLMIGEYMIFSKKTFAVTALATAISLAGCSSDDPDSGSSISTTAIPGIAVDGYLAGATVYVDLNNNGRKNAGEPSAITDKDGYFSTSKMDEVSGEVIDYCAADATSLQAIHCLRTAAVESGLVIRTFGGFDLFTFEPFEGSLASRVEVSEDGVVGNRMISPLTSMLVDVPEDEHQTVLDAFGLDKDALDEDFLDSAGYDANSVNNAIKLHKVVTLLAEAFTEQYEEFGSERSFPETPNAIIYKALAENIETQGVLNAAAISAAFADAQEAINALYAADEGLTFPGNANGTAAISNATDILGLVDSAIPVSTLLEDTKTRLIGVETVVKKMLDGDGDVGAAISEASNPGSGLYNAITDAFLEENGDIDFTALSGVNYSALEAEDEPYSNVAFIGGRSFADLADRQLYISLNENGQSGSGYIFFNSEEDAKGGELKLCLKYDDGDDTSTEFEETDGVLLSGIWLSINDSKLILSLAGSLALSLTDKGDTPDNKKRYSLSYGGETLNWISDVGILDELASPGEVVVQPTDDASCASLLAPEV